ncbi:hypothetical protein SteCoe_7555 [Stentor coeruleus]|uniref:Uncharacterized protein n=1 Tax=Stentor coeruleus TaxID=5963 RepID=A0A1R2CMJ1_9CILI|nr:hypothetical protein SteCoe_7555 [Stentor coeruleus]
MRYVKKDHAKELSNRKHDLFKSLNNLRLVSLTPEISNDKKHFIKIINSSKVIEKSLSPSSRYSQIKPPHIHVGHKSKESPDELENDNSPTNFTAKFHGFSIKKLLCESFKSPKVNKSFEFKRKTSLFTPSSNKSMMQSHRA